MASQLGGYRSPVNLGLGKLPDVADPALFDELTLVYNSIHLINSYLDRLRIIAEGGGSGQAPSATMPFNKFFIAKALQAVAVGDVVAPSGISGQNGMLKGALAHLYTSTAPESHFAGIALTAADAGEDFRVGVGPAILEVPGATGGEVIWAYASRSVTGNPSGQGGLYLSDPGTTTAPLGGTVYSMPVATGVGNGYAMFGQFIRR